MRSSFCSPRVLLCRRPGNSKWKWPENTHVYKVARLGLTYEDIVEGLTKPPEKHLKYAPRVMRKPVEKKKKGRAKKLYCVCQQPADDRPYLQCDKCEGWYHFDCLRSMCKIAIPEGRFSGDFVCPVCKVKEEGE